jgi:hypothetical protein
MILLGAMGSLTLASQQDQQTWTGFVTDTHCGTNCQLTSAMKPDARCVHECIRKGSKYGLWIGKHVYTLEPQDKVARYAATDVRVTGRITGDTIHVNSIHTLSEK